MIVAITCCHSRERGNPSLDVEWWSKAKWIPAFAGMTAGSSSDRTDRRRKRKILMTIALSQCDVVGEPRRGENHPPSTPDTAPELTISLDAAHEIPHNLLWSKRLIDRSCSVSSRRIREFGGQSVTAQGELFRYASYSGLTCYRRLSVGLVKYPGYGYAGCPGSPTNGIVPLSKPRRIAILFMSHLVTTNGHRQREDLAFSPRPASCLRVYWVEGYRRWISALDYSGFWWCRQ